MFSFYRLVEELEKAASKVQIDRYTAEELRVIKSMNNEEFHKWINEDRWMKAPGVNPTERYARQWKKLITRAAMLRRSERRGKLSGPLDDRGYSKDNYRNAQVSKKLAIKSKED